MSQQDSDTPPVVAKTVSGYVNCDFCGGQFKFAETDLSANGHTVAIRTKVEGEQICLHHPDAMLKRKQKSTFKTTYDDDTGFRCNKCRDARIETTQHLQVMMTYVYQEDVSSEDAVKLRKQLSERFADKALGDIRSDFYKWPGG